MPKALPAKIVAPKRSVGRPTDYRSEYCQQATKLCLLGATDEEIAKFFNVSKQTIYTWQSLHPEFLDSIKNGKQTADAQVATKLHNRATGYQWTEQQTFKLKVDQFREELEVVDVKREVPPDTAAAIFWLKNRRSSDWRDKIDVTSGGRNVASVFVMLGPDDPDPADK